jgi:hypothetical protein
MTPAGRFLYLDWAQAQVTGSDRDSGGSLTHLVAQHDGYRRMNALHQRSVSISSNGDWLVRDELLPVKGQVSQLAVTLNWLLPDWQWKAHPDVQNPSRLDHVIKILSPHGWIELSFAAEGDFPAQLQIVRSGELVHGEGESSPTWGWASPTYGVKIPALALRLTVSGVLPLSILTTWSFP